MGFCYLNNIAIAAAKYIDQHPKNKVAILDIDCHHGNGTEAILENNESAIYLSLHQSPLYPGTGIQSHDNCHNFPLLPGTDEAKYLEVLHKACEDIKKFSPWLIGISAGFDTYQGDPLTQLNLTVNAYRKIGKVIANLNRPTFIVMEGGYSPDLPNCVLSFIQGLDKNIH